MKSTLRLLSVFLLLVIPLLTACTQTVDIYFHPDESWQVKSRLKFSAQEMFLFRGVIQDFLVEITQEVIPSQMLQVDDWPGPAFDLLKAYYANEGIEFRWQKLFNSYSMEAEGRNLEQFENLLPGAIAIEKLEDDQYHLNINLGEFNMFAAMVYKQTIILHGGEIINSNAPTQTSNTAVWNNPKEIDVMFEAGDQLSFTWLMALIVILIVTAAIIVFIKNRSSQIGKAVYLTFHIQNYSRGKGKGVKKMKPFFRLVQFMVIFFSLLFVSCTPTAVQPGPVAADTPVPLTPTPSPTLVQPGSDATDTPASLTPTPSTTTTLVQLASPPLSHGRFTPIYIAIDESTSMKKDDCDTNYYRYKVPSFLLNVVNSLGDEFKPIDGSPTPNLMLVEKKDQLENPSPVRLASGDQASDEIKGLIKEPRSFENHPFIPVLNTYKSNLSQSPESTLFFFTDGDFTGLPSVDPKTLANNVMRQFRDIHIDFPKAEIYIFLLCADRFKDDLSDSDYDYIKQTWNDISTFEYATVYGLDQDKMIPNDLETGTILKQLLDTVFRDQGLPENSDPSPESSWGWGFLNQEPDRFLYVYPPTVRLKFDTVSFDENAAHPLILLDGQVLDRSFILPAKECGLHELRITNPPPLSFYWWQADTPQFSLENLSWQLDVPKFPLALTSSPIIFYNRFPSSINAKFVLKSSWDGLILPNTNSLLNYSECMRFQARVNEGEWIDMDPSGKFILANPLPDGANALVDVGYRSIWDGGIETDSHPSSDARVRYFPEYKDGRIDSHSFSGLNNVRFVLAFDFLSDEYYPQGANYQLNAIFTDRSCSYSAGGDPIPRGFKITYPSEQETTAELFPESTGEEWIKCEHFEINWTNILSTEEGWINPDKIRVTCDLNWSNNDGASVMLDSIKCQQGEK